MKNVADYSSQEYDEQLARITDEAEVADRAERIGPARRFCTRGKKRALPLPGCSDVFRASSKTKKYLRRLRKSLDRKGLLRKFVLVPDRELHLTMVDLVSSRQYIGLLDAHREKELKSEVRRIFKQMGKTKLRAPRMNIRGLTIFPKSSPTVLVAAVGYNKARDYITLVNFRKYFLDCSTTLQDMGVTREFPYTFHITLAYAEDFLEREERRALAQGIQKTNKRIAANSLHAFRIRRASLVKFDDMSRFVPCGAPFVFRT